MLPVFHNFFLLALLVSPVNGRRSNIIARRTSDGHNLVLGEDKKKAEWKDKRKFAKKKNCKLEKDGKTFPPTTTWSPTITPMPSITPFHSTDGLMMSSGRSGCEEVPPEVSTFSPSTESMVPLPDSDSASPIGVVNKIQSEDMLDTTSVAPLMAPSAPIEVPPPVRVVVVHTVAPVIVPSGVPSSYPIIAPSATQTASPSEIPFDIQTIEPTEFSIESQSKFPLNDAIEGDKYELERACKEQKAGKIYRTQQSINIDFASEILLYTKHISRDKIVQSLQINIQDYLNPKLIICHRRRLLHGTVGLEVKMELKVDESCEFLFPSKEYEECNIIQGKIQLYILSDSKAEESIARNEIFAYLIDKFDDDNKTTDKDKKKGKKHSHDSTEKEVEFVDPKIGILGLHFCGISCNEESLKDENDTSSNQNSRTPDQNSKTQDQNTVNEMGKKVMSGIGFVITALACISVVVLAIFARKFHQSKSNETTLADLKESDDSTYPDTRINSFDNEDFSAINSLPSLYDSPTNKSEDQNLQIGEVSSPIFLNHHGDRIPSSFFNERDYHVSDTVDL